jgi:hypothetical protein
MCCALFWAGGSTTLCVVFHTVVQHGGATTVEDRFRFAAPQLVAADSAPQDKKLPGRPRKDSTQVVVAVAGQEVAAPLLSDVWKEQVRKYACHRDDREIKWDKSDKIKLRQEAMDMHEEYVERVSAKLQQRRDNMKAKAAATRAQSAALGKKRKDPPSGGVAAAPPVAVSHPRSRALLPQVFGRESQYHAPLPGTSMVAEAALQAQANIDRMQQVHDMARALHARDRFDSDDDMDLSGEDEVLASLNMFCPS